MFNLPKTQVILFSFLLIVLTNVNSFAQISYLDKQWEQDYGMTFNSEHSDFVIDATGNLYYSVIDNNIVKIFTVTTSSNASACWWRRAIVASISPGASRWRRGEGPSDSDSRRAPRPAPVDGAAARAPATQTAAARPARRRSMSPRPARRGPQRLRQPPRSPHGAGRWRRCRRGEDFRNSYSRLAPRAAPVDAAAARAPATPTAAARPARRRASA